MYTLKRKHNDRDLEDLKNGWAVGEWEGETVWFYPSMRYGQPAVTAHGMTQAIWKELSTFGPTPPKKLYFSKRQLLAITGKSWTGKNREFGENALFQISEAFLEFSIKNPEEGTTTKIRTSFLQEIKIEIDDETGATESLVLVLSDFAHDCLTNKDVLLFNWDRLSELGGDPIAINLAKYFTARGFKLMDRKTGEPNFSRRLGYKKDYGDVCDQYLGGLTVRKSKSKIEEQLGRAFKSLHRAKFGAMYVKKSKTTASGFNIHFKPMDGFYNDYNALLRSPKRRTPNHDKVHRDNDANSAPVMLASHFHQQMGREGGHTLLKKEVTYLRGLLERYTYSEIEDLIDYAAKICRKNRNIPDRANVLSGWEDAWNGHKALAEKRAAARAKTNKCKLCGADGMTTLLRNDGTPVVYSCPCDQQELMRIAAEKGMSIPSNLID